MATPYTPQADAQNPSAMLKKLERYVGAIKAVRNLNTLSRQQKEVALQLRDDVSAARYHLDEYYNADDTAEMPGLLAEAIRRLDGVLAGILIASQHDLIDMVDVSHLSALTELIIEQLR